MISHNSPNVSQFIRQGDRFWLRREFNPLDDMIE
jgi:hypothetical protein